MRWLLMAMGALGAARAEVFRLDYMSLSAGNWTTYEAGSWPDRQNYATLPGLDAYFRLWGLSGQLGLALKGTENRDISQSRYGPGQGSLSLGGKLGGFRLRAGAGFPLGYAWDVDDSAVNEVFVGPGTVDALAAVGWSAPSFLGRRHMSLAAEVQVSAAVTRALADLGSWHTFAYADYGYRWHRRVKTSLTLLFMGDYWRWIPTYWVGDEEFKLTLAPAASVEYRVADGTGIKLGGGASVFSLRRLWRNGARREAAAEKALFYSLSISRAF